MHHDILIAGWDHVQGGWMIECICGFITGTCPYMEVVGGEYDNHLRSCGVLKEEDETDT